MDFLSADDEGLIGEADKDWDNEASAEASAIPEKYSGSELKTNLWSRVISVTALAQGEPQAFTINSELIFSRALGAIPREAGPDSNTVLFDPRVYEAEFSPLLTQDHHLTGSQLETLGQ